MQQYQAGNTLFIEADEAEDTGTWWLDATISKVIRHNVTDAYFVAERLHGDPRIVLWHNPATFEDEYRLCSTWHVTTSYDKASARYHYDLPVNMVKYSVQDVINQRKRAYL